MKSREYVFAFEPAALLIFIFVMIPNAIWFMFPLPDDILSEAQSLAMLDSVSVCLQIMMIASLCFLKRMEKGKTMMAFPMMSAGCICLYYICWTAYYMSLVDSVIILGLSIFPCLSFLFFAVGRRNLIGAILAVLFAICHFAQTLIAYFP